MKAAYTVLISMAVVCACASRPSDWRDISARLREGMTENQAIAAIGYAPNTTELVNCGAARGTVWECRMLYFGSSASEQHALVVYEANYNGVWRVDSWNVL